MSEMRFVRNERGREQLVIDDAKLLFHNFSGAKTDFNALGNRNFDVILPDNEMAIAMGQKGWNVKIRRPRDPEDDPYYTLNVKINMASRWPPKIVEAGKRQQIVYDESMLNKLDNLPMEDIGIVINGSEWENERYGKGVKAYLDQFYFRARPSIFGNKYDVEQVEKDQEHSAYRDRCSTQLIEKGICTDAVLQHLFFVLAGASCEHAVKVHTDRPCQYERSQIHSELVCRDVVRDV